MNLITSLRQWFAEHSTVTIAMVGVIILGTAWWIWSNSTTKYPPFKMPTAVFYDEETGAFVEAPANSIPPLPNGRNGALTVVGTLYAEGQPGKDAPTLLYEYDEAARKQPRPLEISKLIRRPGTGDPENEWVPRNSPQGTLLFNRYMGEAIQRYMNGGGPVTPLDTSAPPGH
jgi:hypothetical protein